MESHASRYQVSKGHVNNKRKDTERLENPHIIILLSFLKNEANDVAPLSGLPLMGLSQNRQKKSVLDILTMSAVLTSWKHISCVGGPFGNDSITEKIIGPIRYFCPVRLELVLYEQNYLA